MKTLTADQVLYACRALSLSYEADARQPDGLWRARCPLCVLHTEKLDMEISEPGRGRAVRLTCRNGCDPAQIAERLAAGVPAEDRAEGSPIRFLDVQAMVSSPPPPVAWLAPPILPRASLTALFAPGGDGKSLLAAALACAIARGGEVAGIACETGRTVYLDGENGEWEIHRRVHTLDMPTEGVEVADASGFDLRQHLDLLADIIRERKPDLVVLDSLRSLTPGLDENDTKQTAGVLDPLRRLFHESNTAGLLIHHANKGGKDFRGASSIRDSCDVLWHLGRHDDDDDSRRRFLACRKMRVAAEPERLWLRLEVDRGRVLIDKADSPVDAETRVTQPVRQLLSDQILAGMNGKPEKLASIAAMVDRGSKDGSVRNALAALVSAELVERDGSEYRKVHAPEVQQVQTVQSETLHLAPDEVQSAIPLKGLAPLHPASTGDHDPEPEHPETYTAAGATPANGLNPTTRRTA